MNNPYESNSPPPAPPAPVIQENLVGPTVTYALIAVTVLVFLAQVGTNSFLGVDIPAMLGMKDNASIMSGQLWRLVTPMFLHDDSNILHIGFNMYALVIIGTGLERRFGHWRFLLLYVLGAIGGNVFSFLMSPSPSLGASTAIFGLLGAELVFFYQNREIFGKGARRAIQNVVLIAGVNFVIGLSPGIDNWGHLGGLVAGLIFTWFAGPKLSLVGGYPTLSVVDERGPQDQMLGAFLVLLLFGFLTAARIFGFL
jgi:rhomboid protease GluP